MSKISNRFNDLKKDFKTDTGLDFNKDNMELYIQYFNARMTDHSNQVLQTLTNEIVNQVDRLKESGYYKK